MKSIRLAAWLLASLCAFVGISCRPTHDQEPAPTDLVQVSYGQTQCADKWGFTRDNQQLQTLAIAYLAQQGITLTNTHASQVTAGATCNACTCGTGVVLTGEVPSTQLAAIQALGFTKR